MKKNISKGFFINVKKNHLTAIQLKRENAMHRTKFATLCIPSSAGPQCTVHLPSNKQQTDKRNETETFWLVFGFGLYIYS